MRIKAGNDVKIKVLCKDQDGEIITTLASAADIVCQFKTAKEETATIIEKKESLGQITVDDPTTGYLQIAIAEADTKDIGGNKYYFAIEIQWTGDKQELYLYDTIGNEFNTIEIIEHIIL